MYKENTNPIMPPWLGNPHMAAPCPCGNPIDSTSMLIESDDGLMYLLHERCVEVIDE